MAVVRILGIDPGTVVLGFACLEVDECVRSPHGVRTPNALRAGNVVRLAGARGRARLVECGAVRLGVRGASIAARLCRLTEWLAESIARLRPDEVALEEAFCGKSVQSALRIGEARGVVLAGAHQSGLCVHQYTPARIKRCVAGHGGASKTAVAEMAGRILGVSRIDGPHDVSDAVAVALCRVEERKGFRA